MRNPRSEKYTRLLTGAMSVFSGAPLFGYAFAVSVGVIQASAALASTVGCGLLYGASITFGGKTQASQVLYGATNKSFKFMTFGFRNLKGLTGRDNAENHSVLNNEDGERSEFTSPIPEDDASTAGPINHEHEKKSIENFLNSPHLYIDGPTSTPLFGDFKVAEFINMARNNDYKNNDYDSFIVGKPNKYMVKFVEYVAGKYYENVTPEVIEGCELGNELDAKKKELNKMVNKYFSEDTGMQSKLKIFIDCCDEFKFHKNGYKEDNKDGGEDGGESFKDIWDRKNKKPEETLPKPVSLGVLPVVSILPVEGILPVVGRVVDADNVLLKDNHLQDIQMPVRLIPQGATTPQTYTASSSPVQDVKSHQIENAPKYTPFENPGDTSQLAVLPMPVPMPSPSPQIGSPGFIEVKSKSSQSQHDSSRSTQPSPLFQMPVPLSIR